jgi:hypothetical protein
MFHEGNGTVTSAPMSPSAYEEIADNKRNG